MQVYTDEQVQTPWVSGLPEMFHQYLLGLAEAADVANEGAQRFELEVVNSTGWGVQDVMHITEANPDGKRYRLFGFAPVTMSLGVMPTPDGPLLVPAQAAGKEGPKWTA